MSNSKVVVITGVSSGIGRATALILAKQGCQVFGTVRNAEKAQAIPGLCSSRWIFVTTYQLNEESKHHRSSQAYRRAGQ